MEIKKKLLNGNHNFRLYTVGFIVNLLGLCNGLSALWATIVLGKITKNSDDNPIGRPITTLEESWIVSLMNFGAFLSPLITGFLTDILGRKLILLIMVVPNTLCYLILLFATDVGLYYGARFLAGLSLGAVFSIVPSYIGEISEDSNRGALGVLLNTLQNFGALIAFCAGPFISVPVYSIFNLVSLVIFFVLFLFFAPESPYFLISKNKTSEAENSLRRLRRGSVSEELSAIVQNVAETKALPKGNFIQLLKSKPNRKGFLIGLGLMLFQQFTGLMVLMPYLHTIFDLVSEDFSSDLSLIIVGVINFVFNFIATFLVDNLGRKLLLTVSLIGVALSQAVVGTYFFLDNEKVNLSDVFWLPLTCVIIFNISYNIGIGPISWSMVGELFSPQFKSLATSLISSFCLFLAFLLTLFVPNLQEIIGVWWCYWFYAVASFVGVVFIVMIVPETKGKSLKEIQEELGR